MAGKTVSSFEQFMALAAPRTDTVQIRGCKVHIRELSDRQREEVSKANKDGPEECMAAILSFGVVNAEGEPLMSREQARDYGNGSPEVIKKIGDAIMKLSGLDEEQEEEPGKD
jgi:hypothetical protein